MTTRKAKNMVLYYTFNIKEIMRRLTLTICNQEKKLVCTSYYIILLLIYSFSLFYFISSIYLFFNTDFQNMLLIINPNASIFSILYVGMLLFTLPFLSMSKLATPSNFYTIYFNSRIYYTLYCNKIYSIPLICPIPP